MLQSQQKRNAQSLSLKKGAGAICHNCSTIYHLGVNGALDQHSKVVLDSCHSYKFSLQVSLYHIICNLSEQAG